ncbi:fumarylacetoacetase [Polaromonas jejuensis]|uniref:fumarylacetoacetase n=1 Tax=Polaromonas jejuensis TaxID=457502 RepID=A0ABW0QAN0_9BURK|nr:fumarylacetoacetase [Polaromonas jejuensis]
MTQLNRTHDPALRSWVESANAEGADFPIQNLPFCVFRRKGVDEPARCGVGIGDSILDIGLCTPLFDGAASQAAMSCREPSLNALMALGLDTASALRARLSELLSATHVQHRAALAEALLPITAADLVLPVRVGGFTDFFASVHHATNAGRLFRPDMPLLPNYKFVPIAYNGRASSVRVSGMPVHRPRGQIKVPSQAEPVYAPAQRLDYEVELGMYVGEGSMVGSPINVAHASRHIFGFSLLNDWSARDIQAWEYQPLGPFLAKSFATTVAPWVITAEALAPFRTAAMARASVDPQPLPYLHDVLDQREGGLQIQIDAHLRSAQMAARGLPAKQLSRSNASALYWTFAQMVAHHTSNGSSLDTGDLLGSGTISGEADDALGSLLEITRGGARPFELDTGEQRTFLCDGDEIVLTACCERPGYVRIGFGECRAMLMACTPEQD